MPVDETALAELNPGSGSTLDLSERNIGTVALPDATGGEWEFRTLGARVGHVTYQNATSVSGHIAPIFGLGMTNRGTGGNFVGGGGGIIASTTREWCRFVARRGDGQTFSGEGGCELALRDGGPLLVSYARIGEKNQEFLLFNPESGISQLKITAEQLVERHHFNWKLLFFYVVALACFQSLVPSAIALGLILFAIPTWELYKARASTREFKATRDQIDQGIAIVSSDFQSRSAAVGV